MKVCDLCKENVLSKPTLVEFNFELIRSGFTPDREDEYKVELCSINCFDRWYKEKFMKWYKKKVAEMV